MVDKAVKFFKRLNKKEAERVSEVLNSVRSNCLDDLDVKKMRGHSNLYRVRVGTIRVVFAKQPVTNKHKVVFVGRRGSSEYKKF